MPIPQRTFLAPVALLTAFNAVLAIYVERQHYDTRPLHLAGRVYEAHWWFKLAVSPVWLWFWPLVGVIALLALRTSSSLGMPVLVALILAAAGFFTFAVGV